MSEATRSCLEHLDLRSNYFGKYGSDAVGFVFWREVVMYYAMYTTWRSPARQRDIYLLVPATLLPRESIV